MRYTRLLLALFVLAASAVRLVSSVPAAAAGRFLSQAPLPPVMWTCQTRPEILEDRPGPCPIDEMPGMKMAMIPVRLASVWSCPVHTVVARVGPGKCPIDHTRDLVEVVVAMSWTCPGHPDIDQVNPGLCPDGSPMLVKYARRPHGDHNPRHGGQFFMAADSWHHLEGTYPEKGLFRLYLYDDYGKPLPIETITQVEARVVTTEAFDSATRATHETSVRLLVARDGALEARVDPLTLPAQLAAKVKFRRDGPEYRFDFSFAELTREPAAPR